MAGVEEKKFSGDSNADVSVTTLQRKPVQYDPSKESRLTRLGLNLESFKKAPGATGGHVVHGKHNIDDPEIVNDSESERLPRPMSGCTHPFEESL